MDMPVFDFLEGMSPWWWVAFGLALGAVEMATFSLFLIWPALAALTMAGLVALSPTMPGEVQVASYATLAVALTFAGRWAVRRWGDGGGRPTDLNDRAAQMIGRRAIVLWVQHGEASVEIDGVHWRAEVEIGADNLNAGDPVEVVGGEGMTLKVRALARH